MTYSTKSSIIIVFSILCFIAVIGIVLGLIIPGVYDLLDLRIEKSQKETERTIKANLVEKVKALSSQYKNVDPETLAKVGSAVPQGLGLPELLTQIEASAAESNLVLESADFNPLALKAAEGVATKRAVVATLIFKGDYPAFRKWLELIETDVRMLDIQAVEFNLSSIERNFFNLRVKFLAYYQ